jgi:hypothetical protein
MHRDLIFRYGGTRYVCRIDAAVYDRQRTHLWHYLDLADTGPVRQEVHYQLTTSDTAYARSLPDTPPRGRHSAFESVWYDQWRFGSRTVYRPTTPYVDWVRDDHLFAVDGDAVEVMTRTGADEPERFLMYVLREVALRDWEERGATQFHAACVVGAGADAVLIVGDKAAGKTTTAATLLAAGGMSLCANDRTLVVGGTGEVLGLPLVLRVGRGLVAGTPTLASLAARLFRPQQSIVDDPESAAFGSRRKYLMTPREFATALGGSLAPVGHVRRLLFPRLSDDDRPLWSEPIDPVEAAQALRSSCYTPHDPVWREPRFRPRTTPIAALAATADRACEALSAVPAQRIGWGVRADLAAVRAGLARLG